MDGDGPSAPRYANRPPAKGGNGSGQSSRAESLPARGYEDAVREKVFAFITRHGMSALIGRRPETAPALPPCDAAAVSLLADLALAGNGPALRQMFTTYLDAGWSNKVLLLELMTPAVRLIGRYWEEDRCDFATVSLASSLMQRVVHEVTDAQRRPAAAGARKALIAVTPGDQHSLGAVVTSELFRQAGWSVQTRLDATTSELVREAASGHYAVIGFSLSRTSRLEDLRATIAAIRNSCTKPVQIIVGGRVFMSGEAYAEDVGADGAAIDGPEMIGLLDDRSTIVAAD